MTAAVHLGHGAAGAECGVAAAGASVNDKFMMFGVINIMTVRPRTAAAADARQTTASRQGRGGRARGPRLGGRGRGWEEEGGGRSGPAAVLRAWIIYQPSPVSIKGSAVTECDTDINGEFYLQKMCHESKLGSRPGRAMRAQCSIVSVGGAGRLRDTQGIS